MFINFVFDNIVKVNNIIKYELIIYLFISFYELIY